MVRKQPKRKARPGLDEYGRTPLHYAAAEGNVMRCHQLLTSGSDPNAQDDDSWTPLHFAAQAVSPVVTEILLSAGASVALRTALRTPLETLCYSGQCSQLKATAQSLACSVRREPIRMLRMATGFPRFNLLEQSQTMTLGSGSVNQERRWSLSGGFQLSDEAS
jgi:ankyrin repeat protein